jgi:lipoprotein-releasing system permease protein
MVPIPKLANKLNLSYFISKRISQGSGGSFSTTIHKVAIASIAIGLAVMIISFLILKGFSNTISDKIYGLSGHLQVSKYTLSNSQEEHPISTNSRFYQNQADYPFIRHVQVFAHKPGLLRTDTEVQGIILKGVGADFDPKKITPFIVEGGLPEMDASQDYSSQIIISKKLSQLLRIAVGSELMMYFVQTPPRMRKLTVSGIFETGMEDLDERMIIGDIRLIQRLNDWTPDQVGGFEVFIDDTRLIEEYEELLFSEIDDDLYVKAVQEIYLQVFDWLVLIERNVLIFLILILFVACFNMVSIVLILIMERTQMIGMLKALGASNKLVRRVFINNGLVLTLKGLLIGNLIGIGFGVLQYYFKLIPLDPENYYMHYVPIEWNWGVILLLNLLIFVLVSISLLMPTAGISRISPVKAIRFD